MRAEIAYAVAIVAVAAAVTAVLWYRLRTRRLLKQLEDMLEDAMNGSFSEKKFDESRLSALEAKWRRYLGASEVSSRRLSEEKNKIKELIADISHQTKTPIANLLLYTGLLGEQELEPEQRELVAAVNGQAEKLRFLIEALVKLSRLETGILTLHPVRGAVAPMLKRVQEEFAPKAEGKGIALCLADTAGEAVFDEKWTLEALGNLVDNAIKYTPEGGKVLLRVVNYEMFCCIEVTDTGMGIPEAEVPKVFGRFYRGTTVHKEEGVGIGLYLARQIVSEEGGYIKVKSTPGAGSTFGCYLPRGTYGANVSEL
ncbi:MAG: HAMP domain-containing histidine kinase [Roseburia sp.]|nr:HAMP domain-containing histidine kinase [Roseburia sp.]